MAERGRPRAFDEEEVLDVAISLQLHDGKSWRSAVASQPAETRDRFSSPSSPQVRRRSSSQLIPVCATAISVAPASKYCSIAAASASSSPITASSAGCETPSRLVRP
jgi:hypothetical protein